MSAEMSAGDVLLWLGGTLHAAGANCTADEWRNGVFISYSAGWLRTEENFGLELTPEVARSLPQRVRELVGFKMHGGLGFFSVRDACHCPSRSLPFFAGASLFACRGAGEVGLFIPCGFTSAPLDNRSGYGQPLSSS